MLVLTIQFPFLVIMSCSDEEALSRREECFYQSWEYSVEPLVVSSIEILSMKMEMKRYFLRENHLL